MQGSCSLQNSMWLMKLVALIQGIWLCWSSDAKYYWLLEPLLGRTHVNYSGSLPPGTSK
jgi:hypothetical protein